MTIQEAIEEQELYLQHSDQWSHERLDKAIRLGIEALMIIQKERRDLLSYAGELLPGETE